MGTLTSVVESRTSDAIPRLSLWGSKGVHPPEYPAYSEKYDFGSYQAVLPGHGEVGSGCGDPLPMICRRCGHSYTVNSSCMRRECPHCYHKWASKEAKVVSWRLWGAARKLYVRYRVVHIMISFRPMGDIARERERARKIAVRHGIVGGCMVLHPWRKDRYDHYVPDGYVHFHIMGIALGDIRPGERGDYVFRHIPDPRWHGYRGMRRTGDLRACVRYILTHCGIVAGRHALTWFGSMSYNMLPNKKLDEFYPGVRDKIQEFRRRCPKCGSYEVESLPVVDEGAYYRSSHRTIPFGSARESGDYG